MKRYLLAALLIALMLLAAACGQAAPANGEGGVSEEGGFLDQVAGELGGLTGGDKSYTIAFATSITGVEESNYCNACYQGVLDFVYRHDKQDVVDVYLEETDDMTACSELLKEMASGHNIVIAMGYAFAGMGTVASNYPDTFFILVDAYPTDNVGNVVTASNVYAAVFREEESGFLAGLAAALETKTGSVAAVLGESNASNNDYVLGFQSGVTFANKYYNTKASMVELDGFSGVDSSGKDIGGNYVGSYTDISGAESLARKLSVRGVDVVLVAAGTAGDGVYKVAADNRFRVIGADADLFDKGAYEGGNTVLTSVFKDLGGVAYQQLIAIADGSFLGGNAELGADSGATGYVSDPERQQLSENTLAVLADNYQLLVDGVIIPASSANGYPTDSFPGI